MCPGKGSGVRWRFSSRGFHTFLISRDFAEDIGAKATNRKQAKLTETSSVIESKEGIHDKVFSLSPQLKSQFLSTILCVMDEFLSLLNKNFTVDPLSATQQPSVIFRHFFFSRISFREQKSLTQPGLVFLSTYLVV